MKNKKQSILIALILILLVVLIILLCLVMCHKEEGLPVLKPEKEKLSLDEGQGEYVVPETETDHAKNIVMPGWGSFTVPKGTTHIDRGIDLFNPDGNFWYKCPDCGTQLDENFKCCKESCGKEWTADTADTDCYYMTFALYLEENDELLYQSNLVQPGKHLQAIDISRPLTEGEYAAYVFIQPYFSDMATPSNNGKVKITLYAK